MEEMGWVMCSCTCTASVTWLFDKDGERTFPFGEVRRYWIGLARWRFPMEAGVLTFLSRIGNKSAL